MYHREMVERATQQQSPLRYAAIAALFTALDDLMSDYRSTPEASVSNVGQSAGTDEDPLAAAIENLPAGVGPDLLRDALRWDADPNPTLVLCNAEALVLVDRNGGRVTHAFVMRGRAPRTVSGTFKSYQYRGSRAGPAELKGHPASGQG